MAPIRVGIIGLSKNAETSWASSAHYPYLIASNDKYEIKALCNTSKESAQNAIDAFKLPSTTKAYGNPQDLANDPEIDLVVCSTRVDVHYPTIKPSILAGKDVFVEWPLAQNAHQAEELTHIAQQKGSKTIVGLQGRVSPIYLKAKALLQHGRIGKILNSTVTMAGGLGSRDSISDGLAYFLDRKIGGNLMTIWIGHSTDSLASVLGAIKVTGSNLALTIPEVKVLGANQEILRTITSNVPDYIHIDGTLSAHANAPISILFRRGPPFKGTSAFTWSIQGEKGEIRVEGESAALQAYDVPFKIQVEDIGSGEVEEVGWEDEMKERGLEGPAKNIGMLYERFAEGEGKGDGWPSFGDALERHRFLDEVWGQWRA